MAEHSNTDIGVQRYRPKDQASQNTLHLYILI